MTRLECTCNSTSRDTLPEHDLQLHHAGNQARPTAIRGMSGLHLRGDRTGYSALLAPAGAGSLLVCLRPSAANIPCPCTRHICYLTHPTPLMYIRHITRHITRQVLCHSGHMCHYRQITSLLPPPKTRHTRIRLFETPQLLVETPQLPLKSCLLGSGVRVPRLYHGSGLRAHDSGSDLFRARVQGEGIQPFRVTSRS